MKRPILLLGLLSALGALGLMTPDAHALIDTNNNGLSDLWEKENNNGDLFSETYDPQADPDQDGWTNAQEAAAGTDPDNPNPPDGIIAPDLIHTPAVLGEENGQPIIITPEVLTVSWPTLIGKQYTLLFSPDLSAASWLQVPDSQFIGDGNIHEFNFDLSGGDKCFWRVSVTDIDTDEDGLTDAEEQSLGTNPQLADTDFDGLPDQWEVENGLAANDSTGINGADGDADGDGISNQGERNAGTKANNANDFPLHMITASKSASATSYSLQFNDETMYFGDCEWHAIGSGTFAVTSELVDLNYLQSTLNAFPFPTTAATPGSWSLIHSANLGSSSATATSFAYLSQAEESDDTYSSCAHEAKRIWLKGPVLSQPRTVPFLHYIKSESRSLAQGAALSSAITSVGIHNFTIPAGETLSNHKDLEPGPFPQTNFNVAEQEFLNPFLAADNSPATGVDNVSITAANTPGNGYQNNYWIMAPCGNDTQNHPCENAMEFGIGGLPREDLTATCANAQMQLSQPADGGAHKWHGTSAETSESSPGFTLAGHSVTLPVGIKAMKRRTVKVAVHFVNLLRANGEVREVDSLMIPTEADLGERLYEVFTKQLNTWFEVVPFERNSDGTLKYYQVNPGTDGDFSFNFLNNEDTSADQQQALNGIGSVSGIDIRVFIIANEGTFLVQNEALARGFTNQSAGTCWILGRPTGSGNYNDPNDVISSIAHEIGHVFVGYGHPDVPGQPGDSPLVGTDRTLRLMCSGPNRSLQNGKLLVKTEWDKAEEWLKNVPDKRIRRERGLGADDPTGNY